MFMNDLSQSFASRAFKYEPWLVWATSLQIWIFSQDWAQNWAPFGPFRPRNVKILSVMIPLTALHLEPLNLKPG